MERKYKEIKEINSQEEFEKYGQKISKLVWRGTEEEYHEYFAAKRKSENCLLNLNLAYGFKPRMIRTNDVKWEKILYPDNDNKNKGDNNVFKVLNSIEDAIKNSEYVEEGDLEELFEFLIQKEPLFINNLSGKHLEMHQKYINEFKTNKYKLIDSINLMNDYNCYEKVESLIYKDFFETQDKNLLFGSFWYNSTQEEFLLKINCDLKLPESSVVDITGDVEAQNLKCGLLGANNLKADNIDCEFLICSNLDCDTVSCLGANKNKRLYDLPNDLSNGNGANEFLECDLIVDGKYVNYGKNNMIVGDIVFDDEEDYVEDFPDRIVETGNYIGKKNGVHVMVDSYHYFIGGNINASDVNAENILCGNLKADNVICKNVISSDVELDKEKTIQEASYYEDRYNEQLGNYSVYKTEAELKENYKNISVENIVADNICCSNLKAKTLFASDNVKVINDLSAKIISAKNVEVGNDITGDYIKSDKISGRNVKSNNIVIVEMKADKLELGTTMCYSDSNKIDIGEIDLSKESLYLNPEFKYVDSKINIISEANKQKPKQLASSNDKVLEFE